MSLLNRSQTGSSVAGSKINTIADARSRIVAGLKGQLEIWNKDRGASLPDTKRKGSSEPAKSSLWFKQKALNNDWMLKIKLMQTNIYLSEDSMKSRQPYFSVTEDEMASIMQTTMDQISNGDWDKYITMSTKGKIK